MTVLLIHFPKSCLLHPEGQGLSFSKFKVSGGSYWPPKEAGNSRNTTLYELSIQEGSRDLLSLVLPSWALA